MELHEYRSKKECVDKKVEKTLLCSYRLGAYCNHHTPNEQLPTRARSSKHMKTNQSQSVLSARMDPVTFHIVGGWQRVVREAT